MSDKIEWRHDAGEAEFWTVHKGWMVFIRKSLTGWYWAIIREGVSVRGVENDRPAAEAAAFAAVDRRKVLQ